MIKLDEMYRIDVDSNSWNLCKKIVVKGETKYIAETYHTSLASAVEKYVRIKQAEGISRKKYRSLTAAIKDLKTLQQDIYDRIDM